MSTPRIVSFREPVEAQTQQPAADALLAGQPRQTVRNFYAEASQQFFAGTWSSTRGKWRVRYTEHEFCYLTSGRLAIVSESGERYAFASGDAFVIPAGFAGTWEVVEDCSKLYAIFEAR